ncbi:alpha/beta fold hydrolase [Streptomyces similanensis]|uniref:Peptidase S9 prolyl oligopeptidase catalytic domain-containing protein n=1 Tax=Streptomyces similanensis TaxID=1274988 RepID=A0ABP9KMM4_9ACTN
MAANARDRLTGGPDPRPSSTASRTSSAPRSSDPGAVGTAPRAVGFRRPGGGAGGPGRDAGAAYGPAADRLQELWTAAPADGTAPLNPSARAPLAAPAPLALPDVSAAHDVPQPVTAHGCWYPSVDPGGRQVAFICDRGGVPQLWTGPVDGDAVRLLDGDPDPVVEVSWSPDGRWIAYTTAPGGGELTRVLCVRPDGTGRRVLAGAEPGSSAHLGCWRHDGSALAVTVAEPSAGQEPGAVEAAPVRAQAGTHVPPHPPGWAARNGHAVLLGGPPRATAARPYAPGPDGPVGRAVPGGEAGGGLDASATLTLSAYLVDPEGVAAPVFLASERGAATLRVCDLSRDGRLALLRRGPRARREALVVRVRDLATTCAVPVADDDPWIGGFAPDGLTVWLRSDHGREFAALYALRLDPQGRRRGLAVAAERADRGLELLALDRTGRRALLSWNVRGRSELQIATLDASAEEDDGTGATDGQAGEAAAASGAERAPRLPGLGGPGAAAFGGPSVVPPLREEVAAWDVPLPHEVVTRVVPTAEPDSPVVALSGSQRRPGVWWLPQGTALRTPWSSRDEDVAPDGRAPVRPVPLRPVARDGLALGGWYYRAPGRSPGEPAPCVLHLHGGPEEQERPVFDPLYHELLGRGLDVFAPDVRGSGGHGRSFTDADLGSGRFAAIDDVADCAAHAVLAGPADPQRLAVMGRSYGGYLVMASLVWHPDLFRTGVAVCGMSDFATFFAGTEPWIARSAAHKYGHPEHDRDLLRALSPMSRVDALRAPVLAVHGEHDTNVPPGESEQFVRAARERGLEAALLLLRQEGHDFQRADNRRLFRRTAAEWIERRLTG